MTPEQEKKIKIENMSNKDLLEEITDRLGPCMRCPVEDHPSLSLVKTELEKRLSEFKFEKRKLFINKSDINS